MKPQEFFAKLAAELPNIERRIAHDIIAVEAEQFHAKNFKDEGFTDVSLEKWPASKKPDKNPARKAILVQSSTLKGHAIKGRAHGNQVDFIFPLDYEKLHNEGGEVAITEKSRRFFWFKYKETNDVFWKNLALTKKSSITMPKRQFVGQSAYLDKKIKEKAQRYLDQYLKNL